FLFYCNCDIIFSFKYIIEFHFRNFGPYHIKYVGSNLVMWALQLVKSIVNICFYYLKLYRDLKFNKNIILGLGFNQDIKLLYFQIDPSCNLVYNWHLKVKA